MMRLAQAQGLLTGPDLNPAQVTALALLHNEDRYQDAVRDAKSEVRDIKNALLSANPTTAKHLWPEFFGPPQDGQDDLEDRIEQDDVPVDEIEDIEAFIARASSGTMTGADLVPDEEGWS